MVTSRRSQVVVLCLAAGAFLASAAAVQASKGGRGALRVFTAALYPPGGGQCSGTSTAFIDDYAGQITICVSCTDLMPHESYAVWVGDDESDYAGGEPYVCSATTDGKGRLNAKFSGPWWGKDPVFVRLEGWYVYPLVGYYTPVP